MSLRSERGWRAVVVVAAVLSLMGVAPTRAADVGVGALDGELKGQVKLAVDVGLRHLRESLGDDGEWTIAPRDQALVLYAFVNSHRHYDEGDGPFIRRPMARVADRLRGAGDEGVVDAGERALAALALASASDPETRALAATAASRLGAGAGTQPAARPTADAVIDRALAAHARSVVAGSADDPSWAVDAVRQLAGQEDGLAAIQTLYNRVMAEDSGYVAAYLLAHALYARGQPALPGVDGAAHPWRSELARRLVAQQRFSGEWDGGAQPGASRTEASAFALLALERLYAAP